jgi:hypothetical protein
MQALFPMNRQVAKANWECRPNPEGLLGQIRKTARITKSVADYRARFEQTADYWPAVRRRLTEAERFSTEFLNKTPPLASAIA